MLVSFRFDGSDIDDDMSLLELFCSEETGSRKPSDKCINTKLAANSHLIDNLSILRAFDENLSRLDEYPLKERV